MGILHQQGNDYAGARDYFRRSVAARPDNADSHFRLGLVLADLKDSLGAKSEFQQAIQLGLDSPDVHVALAKALRSTGDTAAAQQQFALYRDKQQAQQARAQAADKAQQGDSAAAAGNLQQSAENYREAVALDPQEPVLAYKFALALDKLGDREGERAALKQALAVDSRMALALNQLGFLDSTDGNSDAAIENFQLAVQADPGFTRAWLNLAASLCLESRWQAARDALANVLALDTNSAGAKALLAKIDQLQAQR